MIRRQGLYLLLLSTVMLGCRRDREPNKFIDGLPLHVEETVLPAYALQELGLLSRDNARIVITEINKTTLPVSSFAELTFVSSNTYQYTLSEAHYGNATVRIQFYDALGASIDPIATKSSTSTIKTVAINTTGTNSLFTYTDNAALTLDISGDITSTMRSTGTAVFNGGGYSITFNLPFPGAQTVIDGFRDGAMTATGTGPGGPVAMTIALSNNQSANGSLTWDGQQGSVSIARNGLGFVITSQARIPIQ